MDILYQAFLNCTNLFEMDNIKIITRECSLY